jgi:hypothetical protein
MHSKNNCFENPASQCRRLQILIYKKYIQKKNSKFIIINNVKNMNLSNLKGVLPKGKFFIFLGNFFFIWGRFSIFLGGIFPFFGKFFCGKFFYFFGKIFPFFGKPFFGKFFYFFGKIFPFFGNVFNICLLKKKFITLTTFRESFRCLNHFRSAYFDRRRRTHCACS